ncbi:MAG: hypothetical protein FWF67_05535 [Fibromonadales bacterium]|nr:hypothetical protein [Fibromonadales bacterium]
MHLTASERSKEARKKREASRPSTKVKVRRKASRKKFIGPVGNKKFNNILMDAIRNFDRKEDKVHKWSKWSEIYKKAGLSKQVASNIYNGKLPAKEALIKIAFAIEATLQEAEDLLKHAGYFLGDYVKRDIIFRHCFEHRITNISKVNILLEQAKEKPLWKIEK